MFSNSFPFFNVLMICNAQSYITFLPYPCKFSARPGLRRNFSRPIRDRFSCWPLSKFAKLVKYGIFSRFPNCHNLLRQICHANLYRPALCFRILQQTEKRFLIEPTIWKDSGFCNMPRDLNISEVFRESYVYTSS